MPGGPEVFISYRVLDNHPPPDGPARGFVDYLLTQIRYDLTQLGIPDAILWQDRSKIAPADDWNEDILSALNSAQLFIAILSKNYITSDWCNKELDTMTSRVETLDARARERRIFRVDKHKVPENKVPISLRTVQSVQFYREDRYSDSVDEYFWRGKVRYIDEYEGAVKKLAQGICSRLEELGVQCQPKEQPKPRVESARPSNGRVVFVAKPAGDMVQPYRTLVRELEDTGFCVTPAPDKDIINLGDEIRPTVVKALEEAEASIHLLGARTGGRPDGLEMDLGPMQLAAAADEAKRRPKFERLIWAPIILPSATSDEGKTARDPLEILGRFGQRLLESDQIDGDTASRFNEFVLQRLGRTSGGPSTEKELDRKIVSIRPGGNRKFAVEIAKELKQVGFNPVLNPPAPLFNQPQHIVVLWGSQSQTKLLEEISAIDASRKSAQPAGGQLILLVTSPPTKSKSEVLIIGMPYVDHIIDARECEEAVQLGKSWLRLWGAMMGSWGASADFDWPFIGLRAFRYGDRKYFFGRDDELDVLELQVKQKRFVTVVGRSGCGKSSLISAGLRPRLATLQDRPWNWIEMHPADAPVRNLALGLADLTGESGVLLQAWADRFERVLTRSSSGIAEALALFPALGESGGSRLLLFVDHFEELLRFANLRFEPDLDPAALAERRDEATAFVRLLLAATKSPDVPIHVVVTIRSDFIGDCARFNGLPEAVSRSQFLVPDMTRDQREDVIRKAIRLAGGRIDPGLVQRALNDTNDDPDQLPSLQYNMMRCWERALDRVKQERDRPPHLTIDDYTRSAA